MHVYVFTLAIDIQRVCSTRAGSFAQLEFDCMHAILLADFQNYLSFLICFWNLKSRKVFIRLNTKTKY